MAIRIKMSSTYELKVGDTKIKQMLIFKYLESALNEVRKFGTEMWRCIVIGNEAFFQIVYKQTIFSQKRRKVYWTHIQYRPSYAVGKAGVSHHWRRQQKCGSTEGYREYHQQNKRSDMKISRKGKQKGLLYVVTERDSRYF